MKRNLTVIISLAILSLANLGRATTLYWDGGTSNISGTGDGISEGGAGTWDTATQNWDQGAGQPYTTWDNTQNYDAYLAGTAGTVTLGAAIIGNSLAFNASSYLISDGGNAAYTLTLNAATNNSSATVGANVVNSTTFSTYGSGTLTLTNTSPGLTGTLAVNGGELTLGNNAASGPGPNSFSTVTIASGATLELNPGAATTYSQTISGPGTLSVHANSYTSTVSVSGANTFSGNVIINQATLGVSSINDATASCLGTGTNVTIGQGASTSDLTYTGYGDTTTRTVTLGGNAGLNTHIIASGYGPLVWLGPLAFANANYHVLTLDGTATYVNVFAGTIPDNTTTNTEFQKSGVGTWLLLGTNTYSGGTLVNGSGTLLITNDYALGAATGAVIFNGSGTIRSISNNVTLGATRTVTVSNTYTASFGVYDANSFYVLSFITGPGSVTKASASQALGWTRFSNDTNNYAGDFTVGFGNTEFSSLANQGTPSSLGQGAVASGGRITLGNSTSVGTLRYVGAGNSATHRPLNWTATTGGYALDNTNTGTIAYLATTQMVNGAGSKTLTLTGSNTGTNTLAQGIGDNGGSTSVTKSGAGQWVLSGTNSYSGGTTISAGTLTIGGAGYLGSGSYAGAIANSGVFIYNSSAAQTLSGVMSGGGALTQAGSGTLTLSGTNTYSGNTTINAGRLALSGSGSIASSPNIIVGNGATFDVSGVSGGYALSSGQTLYATNGATATLNGSLDLSLAALVMTNVPNTPTITVTGGTLTLAGGTAFTVNVNNGGNKLVAGSYKLIAKGTGGSVAGTAPAALTVGGDGYADGATPSLSISAGGELYLDITGGTLTPPVVNGFGLGGGGLVLSFSGPATQTWKILTSTNVAKPLTSWDIVTSGTFGGVTVNYTNTSAVDPQRFYRITSP